MVKFLIKKRGGATNAPEGKKKKKNYQRQREEKVLRGEGKRKKGGK